jgi:hypothetical protein
MVSKTKRDNEELWQQIKEYITSIDISGTKADQWSARKAQLAVKLYKENGGGYIGKKDINNSLAQWTEQNWRTKSGLPSSISNERYLPSEAIYNLTPQQYYQTSLKKKKDTELNKQYSKQPYSISNITKKYR